MISTRKRLFLILCILVIAGILLRLYILHGLHFGAAPIVARTPGAPVLVMVFYEALCPDSKFFILKQLVPTFKAIASHMEVQLVPYGKAQTIVNEDGSFAFKCQHGPMECEANMYHACSLEAIDNPLTRIEFIACMIRDNRKPKEAMYKCAKLHNIENTDLIQKCFDSTHGSELLKLNGDATHALRPKITFIPTVTLDGSQGRQPSILKDLLTEICNIIGDVVPVCVK